MPEDQSVFINEPPAETKEGNVEDKVVRRFMRLMEDNTSLMEFLVDEWDLLREQHDDGMFASDIVDPSIMIHSKESFNMEKKVREKLSPLDWFPKSAKVTPEKEALIIREAARQSQEENNGEEIDPAIVEQQIEKARMAINVDLAKIKAGLQFNLERGGYKNALMSPQDGVHFEIGCGYFIGHSWGK